MGTLTSAQYRQMYGYDTLDRLTQGPAGAGYTYGDANHLDAVTSAPSYSATYDAAGSQTARNGQALTSGARRIGRTLQVAQPAPQIMPTMAPVSASSRSPPPPTAA